jgi:anti-sigma factor RsiW
VRLVRRRDVACREFVEMVTDYLDDALTERLRSAVDRHLAECPGSTSALEQWMVVISLGRQLGEHDVEAVDPAVREALLEAFRRARTEP